MRKVNYKKLLTNCEKLYEGPVSAESLKKAFDRRMTGILIKDDEGFEFFVDPKEFVISASIINNGTWENHIKNILKQTVKKGDKALCLGGHIGTHANLISDLVGDEGKVYVFEPNPVSQEFLKRSMYFNTYNNTTIYAKAAYSHNTTLEFISVDPSVNSGGSYVNKGEALTEARANYTKAPVAPKKIEVEAVSIDSIPEITSIDIIQMDIEGCEPDAMKGV